MKLILSALFVTSLLALNASAQPTPAPAPGSQQTAPPPVLNKQLPAGPRGRPNMPPGLAPGAPKGPPPVMPDKDKLSYAIGFNIAGSIKRDELDIDVDTIATAMKEVLAGKPTRMDEKEVKSHFEGQTELLIFLISEQNQKVGEQDIYNKTALHYLAGHRVVNTKALDLLQAAEGGEAAWSGKRNRWGYTAKELMED